MRFFENAQEFSEEKEGLTVSGWEYDEYHLELADTGSLEEDVLNNYDALLEQAKAAEAENEDGGSEGLEARVDALKSGKADKDEVQAVWDEMAAAYNEGCRKHDDEPGAHFGRDARPGQGRRAGPPRPCAGAGRHGHHRGGGQDSAV